MDSGDLWKLIVLPIFLALSALFSASETAFVALPRARLLHLVNTGKPGAKLVSQMIQRPEKFLATVLLSNNLMNTAATALTTALAISLIDNSDLAVLVATLITTLLLLVFGETLPKTLAWSRAETVAFALSRPLTLVGWILSPAVRLLQVIGTLVTKVFGINGNRFQVTEEEIRTMISVGSEAGTVEPVEAEMLEKVFRFGDRQVQEIMTPRTEIVWVEMHITLGEFLRIYSQQTHTRFPVYEADKENIVGILSVKDLLQTMAQNSLQSDSKVSNVLRPAYFVPETKLIGELFSELRLAGRQMAIVIVQLGGVAGLVTLKRLLEVIVGPVGEEGEPAQEEFSAIGENVYDVDAGIGIQEANSDLGLDLPDGDYQTLAGFILEQLGHIPQEGEHVYYRDLRLEITKMTRLKIDRVQIQWVGQPIEQRGA
ncbi:MAG: HlyC/CorC family transporter [Dehalococcoidia bacterium]|nr:HlyC/CorC family transporter [Dehalococcoidia bacterium]